MAVYQLLNVGANKALSISGSNLKGTSLYNGRSVILWSSSTVADQKWIISDVDGSYIRSYLSREFGLNVVRSDKPSYTCNIHTTKDNTQNTFFDFYKISQGYKIKLSGLVDSDMYLTANGTADGSSVCWARENSSLNQIWRLVKQNVINFGPSTTIYAPVGDRNTAALTQLQRNINATYIYNRLISFGFTKNSACAVLGNFEVESSINPAIYQVANKLENKNEQGKEQYGVAYGLAQWDPGMIFATWAADVDFISAPTASQLNRTAEDTPQKLMDAELAYLIYTATLTGNYFINCNFEEDFQKSYDDVKELAADFAAKYERPNNTNYTERKNKAQAWFDYFS